MCSKPSECSCSRSTGGEWLVLLALLYNGPYMLSRAELAREVRNHPGEKPPNIDDEIANLAAEGLVNVCGDLVGTTRAARFMDELLGSPI
jgi:DNA-binding MarR family transcriptional regulator